MKDVTTQGVKTVHYEKDHDHLGPWKWEVRILDLHSIQEIHETS